MAKPPPPINLNLSGHFILYQYTDVPNEWHVTCLEGGAFGCGDTPDEAFDDLVKTIDGQFEEGLKRGHFAVFQSGPDPEWIQACNDGKHPAEDTIAIAYKGLLSIRVTVHRGKHRVEMSPDLRCESPLSPDAFQHA